MQLGAREINLAFINTVAVRHRGSIVMDNKQPFEEPNVVISALRSELTLVKTVLRVIRASNQRRC